MTQRTSPETAVELADRIEKSIVVSLMEQKKVPGPIWAMPLSDNEQAEIVKALRAHAQRAVPQHPPAGNAADDNDVLQNDLREMLRALGLFDGARPQSPHEVFQECIAEVNRLKAEQPKDIVQRLHIARQTQEDAAALLQRYYLEMKDH